MSAAMTVQEQPLPSSTLAPTLGIDRKRLFLDIGVPFVITRLALLLVGWFSLAFPFWSGYPLAEVLARGWQFTPYRLLDIWGRWDSGWYLDIVRNGYALRGPLDQVQSNVPFFPLYPYLIRLILWPIPLEWQRDGVILFVGVLLSNLFLLGALIFLYLLALELTADVAIAQRTILYLLLFPTAFFLSCFYTDSAFLFFSLAAFYAAQRGQWAWTALATALLGITRPQGIMILPILIWIYMAAAGWRLRNVRRDAAWLLITPIPLLLHLIWLGQITGTMLAPFTAQQAYFRNFAWPWETLLTPAYADLFTPITQGLLLLILAATFVAARQPRTVPYAIWSLLLILFFVFTGVLTSSARYFLAAAPLFVIFGQWGALTTVDRLFQSLFLTLQVLLMIAWCQFYWVA